MSGVAALAPRTAWSAIVKFASHTFTFDAGCITLTKGCRRHFLKKIQRSIISANDADALRAGRLGHTKLAEVG
ncbi:hypothetical protein KC356_g315 [Hortaea werneckii]|nr:hypothetical protein KC356_g315 [Hortaea werneckii]